MNRPRVLVAAIVGNRPAAVYATLTPLLAELCRTSQPDILLAATTGDAGTAHFLKQLQGLFSPHADLHWLPPVLFASDTEWDAARKSLLNHFHDYNRVYLLVKGGKGIWLEQLVYAIKTTASTRTDYYFITSDGQDAMLVNTALQPLRQLPLASIDIGEFLTLNGLQVQKGKKISGTLRNGVLQKGNDDCCQVPFLMLCEQRGFLYAAINAESWLEESHYQQAFRQYLGRCTKLGLERGRILLVIPENRRKASLLARRARELGLAVRSVKIDDQLDKILSRDKVIEQLHNMAATADPRDTTRINDTSPLPHVTRQTASVFHSETLVMAVSGTDSDVNLLALASHRPRQVIFCYDKASNDTIVAAARLQQRLMNEDDLQCEEVYTVKTDQMGRGLAESLAPLRQQFPGPWDINLTPGTKDQAFALLLAADAHDQIWVSDFRRKSMITLTDGEKALPWRYPSLRHIAAHLGGPLKDSGVVVTSRMISDDARMAVQKIFSHLAAINWSSPLSAPTRSSMTSDQRPIIDDNGVMILRETGEQFVLTELFPWFDFSDQEGNHDPNLWLEPFTALCLVEAGADEVVCNMKWSWNSSFTTDSYRDELDVVARFAEKIMVVSCKTNPGSGDRRERYLWEPDHMATTFFGRFARPFLACPLCVEDAQPLTLGQNEKQAGKWTSRTRLLGVNQLAAPAVLKKFLCGE